MKRILFIDRDGTLINEPLDTQQVDDLSKLRFLPGAISELSSIVKLLDYELVMVTNQDGLGTGTFPEDTFWPAHDMMLRILAGEGIVFREVLIDRSSANNPGPRRKPSTAMLTQYMDNNWDLSSSYVIGDRTTDVQLARNLGAKAIRISSELDPAADFTAASWREIRSFLVRQDRFAALARRTNETQVAVNLCIDGNGSHRITTGLPFFNHMLEQLAYHGSIDLVIDVDGDLEIDEHHTVEDTAIALGQALKQALSKKYGIDRFGFSLPMDDCDAQVLIDLSGRAWLVWQAEFKRERVGEMPTELFYHFFKSLSDAIGCNISIRANGENEHHKIEAIFKALGRALRLAVRRDVESSNLPTTKGAL
ncbi:MAG: bifunctional histidinol-phosphatase/imidazoleglycerol-phosphate dehydratase HisB [Bdellovibrionales bacterium]|nr:bifunctional histidinol-phosphatase/imidazoleglycerol-phosphate dehydratase HisB [Bdellovibrionales bacterium]